MPGFLQRLKQRKLVQWALAYVAFAFALLQGVDIVAQQFGWPEVLQRGITLTLALGFFIVLLLAWYHGELGEQSVRGSELMLLALLLAVGGGLLWRFARVAEPAGTVVAAASAGVGADDARPSTPPAVVPADSIAVLPLAYGGAHSQDRMFADGLTEDLITALSQYSGLKVISRNSAFQFRDADEDSAAIGRKLGVARLLEGSVRRDRGQVRISAALVNAADGSTLWSEHYDRPFTDVFALQDDITQAVVSVLRAKLASAPGAVLQSERPPSGNPEAWEAYLRGGRFFESQDISDYGSSVAAYEEAIRLDPHYAQAYAALGRIKTMKAAYWLSGEAARHLFGDARSAVDKALELDPDLAFAHRVRAYLHSVGLFDWNVADAELRRAIQLAPYDGAGKVYYGQLQMILGHPERAIALTREGLASDPRNIRYRAELLGDLVQAGRYAEAEEQIRILSEIAPGYPVAGARAYMALRQGDAAAALAAARNIRYGDHGRNVPETLALQIGEDRAAADAALRSLETAAPEPGIAYSIAQAHALRGEADQVFAWLGRTLDARDPAIHGLLSDPIFARYRGDPRFAALCRAMRLPVPHDGKPGPAAGSTSGLK